MLTHILSLIYSLTHTHTHTHTHMYIHAHTVTHTITNTQNFLSHTHVYMYTHTHTHTHTHIHIHTHTHTGGITTLAIDRDALDEYSRATDSDANLDEFMTRMTRDDVISDDVRRRCTVEVTHVRNSTEVSAAVALISSDYPSPPHSFYPYECRQMLR